MKHQILLTDKIQAIAEERASLRPPEDDLDRLDQWGHDNIQIYQDLGEPSGFLKICYKKKNETEERVCRTCEHRTKTFSHCFKFNMHPELAWIKCKGECWKEWGKV